MEQAGSSYEIYNRPQTRFVAQFVGITNMIPAKVAARRGGYTKLLSIEGTFLTGYDGPLEKEQKVTLLVRPEKCLIRLDMTGGNRVKGRISGCEYLGDSTIISLSLKHNPFTVKIFGPLTCKVGEEVSVWFSPEDCWILRD